MSVSKWAVKTSGAGVLLTEKNIAWRKTAQIRTELVVVMPTILFQLDGDWPPVKQGHSLLVKVQEPVAPNVTLNQIFVILSFSCQT